MNYWGATPFDNEAAEDWLYDFGENDFRLIDRTLAGIANLRAVDVLDEWESSEALVAAECVAAACGQPAAELPDELKEWLDANAPMQVKPEYVTMARQATARVHTRSEARDIWLATEHFDLWDTAVTDLRARLAKI
mgnify:CR=1 FL=1